MELIEKRPSRLVALRHPARYRDQLRAWKQNRNQHHAARLFDALNATAPDAAAIRHAIHKLGTAFKLELLRKTDEIPVAIEAREHDYAACLHRIKAIGAVQGALKAGSPEAAFLTALSRQALQRRERLRAIRDHEAAAETVAQALADACNQPPTENTHAKMSDDGGGGAVLVGTTQRKHVRAIGQSSGRLTASRRDLVRPLESPPRRGDVVDASDDEPPADRRLAEPSPLRQPVDRTFTTAQARKEVQFQTVFKIERDPEAGQRTREVHDLLHAVSTRAGRPLPFGFGQHLLIEQPTEDQKQNIEARLSQAATTEARKANLAIQKNALAANCPVVVQAYVPGEMVASAPAAVRKRLFTDPTLSADVGAALIVSPLLRLSDHLAPDNCGQTNWTNVKVDSAGIQFIDICPPPNPNLSTDSIDQMAVLVAGLQRLAAAVDQHGELPSDWTRYFNDSLSVFFARTFSFDNGLFEIEDFLSDEDAAAYRDLANQYAPFRQANHDALNRKREAATPAERAGCQAEADAAAAAGRPLKAKMDALAARANVGLDDLKNHAGPGLIRGMVSGIDWLVDNEALLKSMYQTLAQTREAPKDKGPGTYAEPRPIPDLLFINDRGRADAGLTRVTGVLTELMPSERTTLRRLTPPAPRDLMGRKA